MKKLQTVGMTAALLALSVSVASARKSGVRREYNEVKNETTVITDNISIKRGIAVVAAFRHEGRTPKPPQEVAMGFYNRRMVTLKHELPVWNDVQSVFLKFGETRREFAVRYHCDRSRNDVVGWVADEELAFDVPVEVFREIAAAPEVLFQVGRMQEKIKPKQMDVLRALAAEMAAGK